MKPYHSEPGVTIYHGDAREVMPQLELRAQRFDACIVDPVWPGATIHLEGADRPAELFAEIATCAARTTSRLVVQIGRDTDPRFLAGVPASMPYLCACYLRFACPGYKGRLLIGGEFAHVFGDVPPPAPGRRVMPTEMCVVGRRERSRPKGAHPCPRRLESVAWLVKWFGGRSVIDPCMGSGTTAVAARDSSVEFVGIEIEERFCEQAVDRLRQSVMFAGGAA